MNGLYLRMVDVSDIDLLYEWANDPESRRNSFNQDVIEYEDHVKWFNSTLHDESVMQFILMNGDSPVGQIRVVIKDDVGEISYSISPDERGRGYGKHIIQMLKGLVTSDYPHIKKLVGKVKPDNAPSQRCFSENAFRETYRQFEYDTAKVDITSGGGVKPRE